MKTLEKLTVRKGKFYRGNDIVPIEHGDKEQIALLKKIKDMQDGFDPYIIIKKIIHMEFRCVCGAWNDFCHFTELDENDDDSMIVGEVDQCHYCGLEFKVIEFHAPHSDYLQLKLVPKPRK